MNTTQYLLIKLAEEAVELSHAAIKASQFGPETKNPGTGKTNIVALQEEYDNITAIVRLLEEQGIWIILPSMEKIRQKMGDTMIYKETSDNYWKDKS